MTTNKDYLVVSSVDMLRHFVAIRAFFTKNQLLTVAAVIATSFPPPHSAKPVVIADVETPSSPTPLPLLPPE